MLINVDDGDSGSWVMKDHKLCGYIFSRVKSRPWAYMLPISTVFDEISGIFSTQLHVPVLLPTAAEIDQKRSSALRPENIVTFSTSTAQQDPAPEAEAGNHASNSTSILPAPSTTSRQVTKYTPTKTALVLSVPISKRTIGWKKVPNARQAKFSTGLGGAGNFRDAEAGISAEEVLSQETLPLNTAREKARKLWQFGRGGAGNSPLRTKRPRRPVLESESPRPKEKLKSAAKVVGRACAETLNFILCIVVTDDFQIKDEFW